MASLNQPRPVFQKTGITTKIEGGERPIPEKTQRSFWSSVRTKHGRQNSSKIGRNDERRPQPSDSPLDPLNWTSLKKNITFVSLLLAVSIVGMQKLQFAPVNSVLATQFSISYTAAVALTGIPFIVSGFAGVGLELISLCIGKRMVYITGAVLMLVGQLWNMHVHDWGQFVGGRILQGIGWGAFALVEGSLREMFFEHELPFRTSMLHGVDIFFTWGTPILGGYLSQSLEGYANEIMIQNIIQAFSILFLIIATPETTFNRHSPPSSNFSSSAVATYYRTTLDPLPYHSKPSIAALLRPIRSLMTPTTVLTFLLCTLPIATAYGFALTLSSILSSSPLFIFPSALGYLFLGPSLLSLLVFTLLSILSRSPISSSTTLPSSSSSLLKTYLKSAVPALLFFLIGTVAFTQYTSTTLQPTLASSANQTIFLVPAGEQLSLRVVSLLLGILVMGAVVLERAGRGIVFSASSPRMADLGEDGGSAMRMQRAYMAWRDVLVGIVVMVMPRWISDGGIGAVGGVEGLRDVGAGVGIVAAVVGGVVVGVLWGCGEKVRACDERVLGGMEVGSLGKAQNDEEWEMEIGRWKKGSFDKEVGV
ncbi:hypothetical protein ACMFMG_011645 [Clarireedia jacksonii]